MYFSTIHLSDRWKTSFLFMRMIDGSSILGSLGNSIDVMILVTCSKLSILLMLPYQLTYFFLFLTNLLNNYTILTLLDGELGLLYPTKQKKERP